MPWSLLLLLVLLAPTAVHTQDFVFAQSTPLTGDLGLVGQQLSIGIRAAFEQTNLNGGVEGKLLRLYTLDDGYEPTQTVNNTIQFLSNNTVFGLIGYYGSATTTASLPYILNTSTPLIGPVTGSMLVRSPFIKQVLNIRPSYAGKLFF
jgi:ABC-type branched-subunit amino acid transport system substrate-binding protein